VAAKPSTPDEQPLRLTAIDVGGFFCSVALTTTPLLAVTWLGDNLSKDGPIGFPAYVLPFAIGMFASVLASLMALFARPNSPERFACHVGLGCLASLLLIVTFCMWWGDWCFGFARG